MGIRWFTKGRIIYFLVFGVLWLFWQLFTDELAGIIRGHIPDGGVVMYGITHPYVIMPILLILGCLLLLWWSIRKQGKQTKGQPSTLPSKNLVDTLTLMHRRLVELQKEKASRTKIRYGQWDKVMPTLADRMGTIRLKDWPKFMKHVKRRVQRAALKPKFRRKFNFREWARYRERVEFAALSVASQVKDELFQSKEWTVADGVKVSEWLDGYHWGVKELRDNDPQWKALFDSISSYLRNEQLRELTKWHIDLSYAYNSVCLAVCYSGRFPKSPFSLMLHETLVGSPISPEKAELALSEILEQIEDRLKEIEIEKSNLTIPSIKIVDKYEDNKGECGLIFHNTTLANLINCQARLIDLAFEVPHSRYSMGRYSKAEDLICPQSVPGSSDGKIPLFRWRYSGGAKYDLEIVYKNETRSIGYGILNVPILVLINVWADSVPNTYAICKLEDRLGWGYDLSILESGLMKGEVKLATYQKPNPYIGDSQPE